MRILLMKMITKRFRRFQTMTPSLLHLRFCSNSATWAILITTHPAPLPVSPQPSICLTASEHEPAELLPLAMEVLVSLPDTYLVM